ncbi:MAG: hypothetical protein K6C30_05980 [Bacteroidaceae bacterium]|nr:hypothetical protein [Bacteroidaceae bacterium]
MRKKSLFLLTMIWVTTAFADSYTYPYLTFETSDGSQQSVSVESLVLTVSGSQLVATNSSGTVNFTLAELSQMSFTSTPATHISETEGAEESAVEVFTLSGLSLGKFANLQAARATLQNGIYVIKSKNVTQKIAVK